MDNKIFLASNKKLANQAVNPYHLKILIPNEVVGSIIGKGGSIVMNLEKTYHVKITLSGFKDIYPGSSDRVCLISGNIENILTVNDFIISQISAMADTDHNVCFDYDHKIHFERSKQVKFIIPQISAAKIIGRRGANIERMKMISGSFIQISQSSLKVKLRERCVIVAGDLENNKKACRMIFYVIADDTVLEFYKNISYSKTDFPIPSTFPTGSALARYKKMDALTAAPRELDEACKETNYVGSKKTSKSHIDFLNAIERTLREKAYDDSSIKQAKEAFCVLIDYDLLHSCSSIIMNYWNSDLPLEHSTIGENTAAHALGSASVSFSDTPAIGTNPSDTPNRYGNFFKPSVPDNLASSFISSGRNQDDATFNYMQYWNPFSNPLVSINNCAHINLPNHHPASSDLFQDAHYTTFPRKDSGGAQDIGRKFV